MADDDGERVRGSGRGGERERGKEGARERGSERERERDPPSHTGGRTCLLMSEAARRRRVTHSQQGLPVGGGRGSGGAGQGRGDSGAG